MSSIENHIDSDINLSATRPAPPRHRRNRSRLLAVAAALIAAWTLIQVAPAHAASRPSQGISPPGFLSSQQVALAQFNGLLYMAWVGIDSNHTLNIAFSTNEGDTWSQAYQLGTNSSQSAPALAVFNGKLWYAWTGTDGNHTLNLASSTNGTQFSQATQPLGRNNSPYGPSMAVFNGKLYYAWTGTDGNHTLNIDSSADGVNFASPTQLGTNGSINAPSLAAVGGSLWMAWAGGDPDDFLYEASSTNGFQSWSVGWYSGSVSTLRQPSIAGYDYLVSQPSVLYAYTGTDNNLYNFLSLFGPPATNIASSIANAPAVTVLQDGTVVNAWIDNSGQISLCPATLDHTCG